MTEQSPQRTRIWLVPSFVVLFVAAHLLLFHLLQHARVTHTLIPGALLGGAVFLLILKHLGLLAVLLRPISAWVRRRSRD